MKLSVAGKMTLISSVLLAVVFMATTAVNVVLQERATTGIMKQNGLQLAETAVSVLHKSMVTNSRENIQSTIDDFAVNRDVDRIRLYTRGGQIAYSTDHAEIGTHLDPQEAQCQLCHHKSPPPTRLTPEKRARVVELADRQTMAVSQSLLNRPTCSTTDCHDMETADALLGVLDIDMNLEQFHLARRENAIHMGFAGLIGVILGVLVIYFAGREIVYRRVKRLIAQTEKLSAGDLTVRIDDESTDEIGTLDRSFNLLTLDLQQARTELLEWGKTLEQRVEAKTDELVRAQDQMVQVEKMASLGKLAAVVAHEINNPLASVVTYAKILVRRTKKAELTGGGGEDLKYLESIASEATRCGEIVAQLLTFAHRGSGSLAPINVNETVERALFLVNHQFELSGVDIERHLDGGVPTIVADQNKLQQALMALFINAAQAMYDGGRLEVSTHTVARGLEIVVADDGPGMETEVARHAFEPFYSTKSEDGGVGLGLSVVYGIVKSHSGRIELDTKPGAGCRFTIFLPCQAPKNDEEDV